MLHLFVARCRTCCFAAVLSLATLQAGEPPNPLLGMSRDQVLNRLGEPRSQILTAGREVMFYPRERLVLSNGVVVEVERLAAEPARKLPAPEAPAAATTSKTADPVTSAGKSADAAPRAAEPPPAAPPSDSKVEIKLVRAATAVMPVSVEERAEAVPAAPVPAPATSATPAMPISPSPPTASQSAAVPPAVTQSTVSPSAAPKPTADAPAPKSVAAPAAPVARTESSTTPDAPPADAGFGTTTYVIIGALLVGGIGFLVWRARQRQLELEATAVEATPVGAAAVSRAEEAGFSLEFLAGLPAAAFEELVAAYYVKTGVVAAKAPSDGSSPFQIRISWKGEARAFALVQCLAQPTATIDTQPLVRLHGVLDREKVRRGYVVTPGKFSPAAREFAEEKGLTLLPGDVFLDKLMSLPDSARSELMRAVNDTNRASA